MRLRLLGGILLAALLASPAVAWDRDAHETIARAAMEAAPPALRTVLERRSRALLESAVAPDSRGATASSHGASGARLLVELVDGTRRLQARGELPPGQLATNLGTISHLASDIFAPQGQIAPYGLDKWLDNHGVIYSYDGPTPVDDAALLVARLQRTAGLLDPARDLASMRFDLALNAVLDAWQMATGAAADAWAVDDAERRFGAAWNEKELHDRSEERAEVTADEKRRWIEKAEKAKQEAQFQEMGTQGESRRAQAALDSARGGDPGGELAKEAAKARAAYEAAVAAREEADDLLRRVRAGDIPRPPKPPLAIVERSLHAATAYVELLVRIRNDSPDDWAGVHVTVGGPGGERGFFDLTAPAGHPAGRLCRYECRLVTWGDPAQLTLSYTPAPSIERTPHQAASARAAAEAALRGATDPATSPIPLAGHPSSPELVGEQPAAKRLAEQLSGVAALYEEAGQKLDARFSEDPAAGRERKVARELLDLAASLQADAAGASGSGIVLAYRVATAGDAHTWEIALDGTEADGFTLSGVLLDWDRTTASLRAALDDAILTATKGGRTSDLDLRTRFAAEGILGYGRTGPAPLGAVVGSR